MGIRTSASIDHVGYFDFSTPYKFPLVVGPKLGMFACAINPILSLLVGRPETKCNRLDTSVHEMVRVRTVVEDCLLDQFHPTQDVLSRFSSPKIWNLVVSQPLHPHPVPVARFLAIRSNLAGTASKRGCSVSPLGARHATGHG